MRRAGLAGLSFVLALACACNDDSGSNRDEESQGAFDGAATRGEIESPTARFAAVGVTFEYPTDAIERVTAEAGSAATPFVRVRLDGDALAEPGTLLVTPIRDATGELLVTVTEPTIARLAELDDLLADPDPPGSQLPLDFINGDGVRALRHDETATEYTFLGQTTGRRLLVDLTLSIGADVPPERLDDLVAGLFVDPESAALAPVGCEDDLELIAPTTLTHIPIAPATIVDATWRVRNSGTCTWDDDWSWVYGGGTPLTLISTSQVGIVTPGAETELTATFQAPSEPGHYTAQWQLVSTDGRTTVGPLAPVTIVVDGLETE